MKVSGVEIVPDPVVRGEPATFKISASTGNQSIGCRGLNVLAFVFLIRASCFANCAIVQLCFANCAIVQSAFGSSIVQLCFANCHTFQCSHCLRSSILLAGSYPSC